MGKRDDATPRRTREFDSARLAALTKQPLADKDASSHIEQDDSGVPDRYIAFARAPTIDDPLTTGLLAEVARRSQTADFDDDAIDDVLSKLDSAETSHPHTLRRGSK